MSTGLKQHFLHLLSRTLNPLALRAARMGRGPFSSLRHFGRRSGRMYETPLILARVDDGFVAEQVAGIEDYPAATGLAAFPPAARAILKLLRRNQFRLIRVQPVTGSQHR